MTKKTFDVLVRDSEGGHRWIEIKARNAEAAKQEAYNDPDVVIAVTAHLKVDVA